MSDEAAATIAAALARIPYAGFLGMKSELKGDELTLVLPFAQHLIGNPMVPRMHGGVIGAFMEITALMQLAVTSKSPRYAKTIDIGIDYLRPGKAIDSFARARVVKIGKRVANVQVEAWQGARAEPIAALHGHFLLPDA